MAKMRNSWYLHTLVGRLALALAIAIVLIGLAGGTIYGLATALRASHQSQAICQLARDLGTSEPAAKTATSPGTSAFGIKIIVDSRNAFRRGNCQDVGGGPLPPLTTNQKKLLPPGTQ